MSKTEEKRYKAPMDLARITGRNHSTVRYWIAQGKLVVPGEGFTAAEICQWVADNIQAAGRPKSGQVESSDDSPDFQLARAKREHHNAELARLKVEQVRGNLLEAHAVEAEWSKLIADLNANYDKEIAKFAAKITSFTPATGLKELKALFRRAREKSMIEV